MSGDSKLARRMALKKKIEEEYRLAEERRNVRRIRRYSGYSREDQEDQELVRDNKEEMDKEAIPEVSDENQIEGETLEKERKLDMLEEDNEKEQILKDLERILNKKETITLRLEEYKKKRNSMLELEGRNSPEKDELITETEEKLELFELSIESLIFDLKQLQ